MAMLYRGPFTTAFYRKLHSAAHREFRARAAWRELRRRVEKRGENGHTGGRRRSGIRLMQTLLVNLALLGPTRLQLAALARRPHQALLPISPAMAPDQASLPSPQPEEPATESPTLR
jgi:hypothetical protein